MSESPRYESPLAYPTLLNALTKALLLFYFVTCGLIIVYCLHVGYIGLSS